MPKKKKRSRKKYIKKRNSTLILLTAFVVIALFTVAGLEYIDFKKGKSSFIFSKVIKLKTLAEKSEAFNKEFIRILNKNKIDYKYFQDKGKGKKHHFQLEIEHKRYKGLIKKLKEISAEAKGDVKLTQREGMPGKTINLYKVFLENKATHVILITNLSSQQDKKTDEIVSKVQKKEPKPKEPTHRPRSGSPKIAFIIDDIGAYDIGALELKKLDIPITASILPDSPYALEEARWVREYRLEAMAHIPMQPLNGNGATYNNGKTITLKSSDEEIKRLFERAKKIVPSARGFNNHQGSLATSNKALMMRVLKIAKKEGLFFIDSRTIGNSVAFDVAGQLGIKSAYKDAFLDHIKTYAHSRSQIRRLVEIARAKGQAIGIGHPNDSTLRAIGDSIQYIRSKGVEIVYVSELVQ